MVNVLAFSAADASPTPLGQQCVSPQEAQAAAPPQVTAPMVARAFRRIPLPDSELVVQPPGGETLVNLDTIFSTRAEPFTRTITLLGQRVELRISPETFTWRHGDGTTQQTGEPGRAYERGLPMTAYITHRYAQLADELGPRVDTVWSARFRVGGGPWRDVGETVTITGDPSSLAVREAEPTLVGS